MPVLAHDRAKPSGHQQRVDSVADIKMRWKISDTEYDKICNSFQDTLAEEGVLGDRIQGRTRQSALTNAIEKMLRKRQHQSVLKSKDINTTRCDLRYLAQLLNQNYRRRMKRGKRREADQMKEQATAHPAKCSPGSRERQAAEVKERGTSTMAVHEDRPILEDATSVFKSGTPMSISEKPTQREPPPLTARMLVVRWQDEAASRIYRIQELCPGSDSVSADRLDKLRYEAFLSILVTDFAFSPNSDVVLYNCVDEGIILISNEKIWRAALWDMFNQGDRYLRFRLQRKGTALMHTPSVDTIEHTV